MDRRQFLRASVALLATTLLVTPFSRFAVAAATAPIALGAYISGMPDNSLALHQFTTMVGVAPSVVMWYQDCGPIPALMSRA